jgi:hypothetical protein
MFYPLERGAVKRKDGGTAERRDGTARRNGAAAET